MKDGERFKIGHDENTQWLKIVRIADTDFFPKYTLKINGEKVNFCPVLTEFKSRIQVWLFLCVYIFGIFLRNMVNELMAAT